jgi:hypothetical protein
MRWYTQESNTSSVSRSRDGSAAVSAAARFGYCPVAAALTIGVRAPVLTADHVDHQLDHVVLGRPRCCFRRRTRPRPVGAVSFQAAILGYPAFTGFATVLAARAAASSWDRARPRP